MTDQRPLLPVALATCDPRFDPKGRVTINGYSFAAEHDGWVRVPIEPTEAMLDAGDAAHFRKRNDMTCIAPTEEPDAGGGPFGYAWRAMIAARPANILNSTKEAGHGR